MKVEETIVDQLQTNKSRELSNKFRLSVGRRLYCVEICINEYKERLKNLRLFPQLTLFLHVW